MSSLDFLAPLRLFEVGEWDCMIWQQVTGTLAWHALRLNIEEPKREGTFPAGVSVDQAMGLLREELARSVKSS